VLLRERVGLRLRGLLGTLDERLPGRARPFYCPVCRHHVRGYYPLPRYYERLPRQHGFPYGFEDAETLNWRRYSCRRCGASDRDRLIALHLRDVLAGGRAPRPCQLVDFAPSPPLREALRGIEGVAYRSADLFMPGVDDRVDVAALPYGDRTVDVFVCSHVLEHVPDDRAALRELRRVLRPGGTGVLLVPIVLAAPRIDEDPGPLSAAERWRRFGQDDHVRLYTKQGFVERVEEAGFRLLQLGAAHFGEANLVRCGITPGSVLYVVSPAEGP
jgi:SAM-dependent methyltransferase